MWLVILARKLSTDIVIAVKAWEVVVYVLVMGYQLRRRERKPEELRIYPQRRCVNG